MAAATCVSSATRPTNGHVAVFTVRVPSCPGITAAFSREPAARQTGRGIPRYAGRFEHSMMYQAMRSFRSDPDAVAGKRIERALVRRVFRLARPYRRQLIGFLVTAVAASIVTAIPPLLFRALLDTAVPEKDRLLVTWLALGAVGLALANAVLNLWQRWYSARIGEGLIFDMRTKLFDHVQRMPFSFFTRTQTGALMSRMNNDVIGAQQAITNTLGTVVGNVIGLAVTLTVMLGLEWRLTILTLIVLPAFIIPARRIGRKLVGITREG